MLAPDLNLGTLMSSPTETTPLPDPLPNHLKAMLELNRDAQTSLWGQYLFLNLVFWFVAGFLACVVWRYRLPAGTLNVLMPYFILQSALIGLQGAAERRAQRRLQMLLDVIRDLQHQQKTAGRS